MRRLLWAVLLTSLLCLSSLTFAQTTFDVSGTIQSDTVQGLPVLVPANLSGTLAISLIASPESPFSVSNWTISIPPVQLSNGTTIPAHVFTPADSTASVVTQSTDEGVLSHISFYDAQTQSTLGLNFNGLVLTGTNVGSSTYAFYQNGVQYVENDEQAGSAVLTPVPEPSSSILLATGLAGLPAFRRKLFTRLSAFHS